MVRCFVRAVYEFARLILAYIALFACAVSGEEYFYFIDSKSKRSFEL